MAHQSSYSDRTNTFLVCEPRLVGSAETDSEAWCVTQGAKSAYHEWVVEVSNLVEEVDLIFPGEQRRANTVHGSVSPSLSKDTCHCRVLRSSAPLLTS